MGLSQSQIGIVRRIIEAAPDSAIRTLESALASGRNDNSIAAVHDLVNEEMVERRVRGLVFAPIAKACGAAKPLSLLNFPSQAISLTWRALKADTPDTVDQAVRAVMSGRGAEDGPPIFDMLCAIACDGLRAAETPDYQALSERLESHAPGAADLFARTLALTPLVRSAIPRLPMWIRNVGDEQGPAIRLAFRDATKQGETATPIFMELLANHLDEPWQVLRLISVMMDRPGDRYLASSELAGFGERILRDIDQRVQALSQFDPDGGHAAGVALGNSVLAATNMMAEFGQWLALSKDGPWGLKITEQRKALAAGVEQRLREVEPALAAALPAQQAKYGGKSARLVPKLTGEPDEKAARRAQAYLAFLEGARMSANNGGYGALRLKIVEALEQRLDPYIEDVLEALRHGDVASIPRLRGFLNIAANALGSVRNAEAAEIVRRRMAAA